MTLAILCSGQGLQHPGMFALTGPAPAAAGLFGYAKSLLGGRDPRDLVRTNIDLHDNRLGQTLCTLQPLAVAAALDGFGDTRRIVAGYSVGEVPAWSLAGLMEPRSALDMAARRAEAMDAAGIPGDGLLFIRGLSRDGIASLCAQHSCAVAIVNPGDAVVVGGAGSALDAVAEAARTAGADRVVRIGVKVASHTPRLTAASTSFREGLTQASIASVLRVGARLLSGIDGAPVLDIRTGLDKLAAQVSQTIQWSDCLAGCVEAGATAFLECGPGRALAEMAASAYPRLPSRSLDDFRSLEGVRDWLIRNAA